MISDPIIKEMNETQWAFEAESLLLREEERVKEVTSLFQVGEKTLTYLLGLNLLPIKDENTGLLRFREDNEIIPLSIMTGRDAFIKEVGEKVQELEVQEQVEEEIEKEISEQGELTTADEFDDFMSSDIEFLDDEEEVKKRVIRNTPEYKYIMDSIVSRVDDSKESEPTDDKKLVKSVTVECENVSYGKEVKKKDGVRITIESDSS